MRTLYPGLVSLATWLLSIPKCMKSKPLETFYNQRLSSLPNGSDLQPCLSGSWCVSICALSQEARSLSKESYGSVSARSNTFMRDRTLPII